MNSLLNKNVTYRLRKNSLDCVGLHLISVTPFKYLQSCARKGKLLKHMSSDFLDVSI